MLWELSHRADLDVLPLADRHYSRRRPGSRQFVAPGKCLVLKRRVGSRARALWVTSWQRYVQHDWPGAWMCALFRNESRILSSRLILDAVAATRWRFGAAPDAGMVTFVDPDQVRSSNPGYCFLCAGFERVGRTQDRGLLVLQLLPDKMPEPVAPAGAQLPLEVA